MCNFFVGSARVYIFLLNVDRRHIMLPTTVRTGSVQFRWSVYLAFRASNKQVVVVVYWDRSHKFIQSRSFVRRNRRARAFITILFSNIAFAFLLSMLCLSPVDSVIPKKKKIIASSNSSSSGFADFRDLSYSKQWAKSSVIVRIDHLD